jgi:tRNA pseudouridine38-40 synthase
MDFHSRYSCTGKMYSYRILNRKVPPAYMRNFVAHCPYVLDYTIMESACQSFLGTHDFAAFRSTRGSAKTSVRTVRHIELLKEEDFIVMYIEADGFLYNMVRIIAGTLIDIGRGRIKAEALPFIIECGNRDKAGLTAPASGLCLEKIYY